MKQILLVSVLLMLTQSCSCENKHKDMAQDNKVTMFKEAGYQTDSFTTPVGRPINLIFIKHGSIAIDIDGFLVYVDPVSIFGDDFSKLPKADMVLITHEHHDHLDPQTIEILAADSIPIMSSFRVAELYSRATPLDIDEKVEVKEADFSFKTVPAYNITPDRLTFHPKQRRDLGFLFFIDGFEIYVAGDTEDIPDMADLQKYNIDVAFLPVNQPYTMTVPQAEHAIEMIKPRIVYPYHFNQTNLTPLAEKYKNSNIEIRIRELE